jgi:hypothetical protein
MLQAIIRNDNVDGGIVQEYIDRSRSVAVHGHRHPGQTGDQCRFVTYLVWVAVHCCSSRALRLPSVTSAYYPRAKPDVAQCFNGRDHQWRFASAPNRQVADDDYRNIPAPHPQKAKAEKISS